MAYLVPGTKPARTSKPCASRSSVRYRISRHILSKEDVVLFDVLGSIIRRDVGMVTSEARYSRSSTSSSPTSSAASPHARQRAPAPGHGPVTPWPGHSSYRSLENTAADDARQHRRMPHESERQPIMQSCSTRSLDVRYEGGSMGRLLRLLHAFREDSAGWGLHAE